MKKGNQLTLNVSVSFINQVVTVICGFILPAAIIKTYGSAANGLVSSITQFLSFISLCDLGVGAVTQSALYAPLAEKNRYQISCIMKSSGRFYRIVSMILLVYVFALCLFYPSFADDFDRWFVILMILSLSIDSFANYFFGIKNAMLLEADRKAYLPLVLRSIGTVLNTVCCLALIHMGVSLLTVKFTTALIYLMRPVGMYFYVKKHYQLDYTVTYEKEPIKQKWNGLFQHFASVIVDHTAVIILTVLSTLQNVSVYAVYRMILAAIQAFFTCTQSSIQATVGNLLFQKDKEKLTSFWGQMEWTFHTISVFIFTVVGILIVPFVMIYTSNVTDADYQEPLFAAIFTLAIGIYCVAIIYRLVVKAAGHYRQTQHSSLVEVCINLITSTLLVFKLGLVGIAIGMALTMSYRMLYYVWYLKRNILKRAYSYFIKQLSVDVVSVLLILLATSSIPVASTNYFEWCLSAVAVSLVALAVLAVINLIFYREYIVRFVAKFFNKK